MYNALKEIIKDEAILSNRFNVGDKSFYIKEDDPSAKCRRVTLTNFDSESTTFGFELDCKHRNIKCKNMQKKSPYLKDGKGYDSGNDAVIFANLNGNDYIFIIDLKDNSNNRDKLKQLKSSTCFVDYLKSILKIFHQKNIDRIKPIYIIFSEHGNNLRATGGKKTPSQVGDFYVYHEPCKQSHFSIKRYI